MSQNREWTAEDWRELHAVSSRLLVKVEEISVRLARVEDHLRQRNEKLRPQRRKHAG